MNKLVLLLFIFFSLGLCGHEFTVATYNCGGISNHYDYLRGAAMQKLMEKRYRDEPAMMEVNQKIQSLALKILFSQDKNEKCNFEQEWHDKNYDEILSLLKRSPNAPDSMNTKWNQESEGMITNYKVRPVVIHDPELRLMLEEHIRDLSRDSTADMSKIGVAYRVMAKRIISNHLKFDILCLQEADYLDKSMFPSHYEVSFSDTAHSINGIAWNKDRFELIEIIGNILGRGYVVKLLDKSTNKTLLVASGHISGCNPFEVEMNPQTGEQDCAKGNFELSTIIQTLDRDNADLMLVGMDSNVTSLHPRLCLLKEANYLMDYENHLELTCTSPHLILNTRIDWIALKSTKNISAKITNIPMLGVGLNSIVSNISDHKPVAAKIEY